MADKFWKNISIKCKMFLKIQTGQNLQRELWLKLFYCPRNFNQTVCLCWPLCDHRTSREIMKNNLSDVLQSIFQKLDKIANSVMIWNKIEIEHLALSTGPSIQSSGFNLHFQCSGLPLNVFLLQKLHQCSETLL